MRQTKETARGHRTGEWVRYLLGSRSLPLWLAGIAVAANVQVLDSGLFSDDHFHLAAIVFRLMGLPVEGNWWEIFGVPTARGLPVPTLVQKGMLPWWTSQDYSTSFLRPLAVVTHYFDVVCLHARPEWMHAHNLVWYALLVVLVGLLHRRVIGSPYSAALATLMYAVDEAHSEGVAWIASRNTLMSACAATGTVLVHEHWRRTASTTSMVLATVLFALGLAAGEGGIAAWAYLIAYAVVLDTGRLAARLRSVAPYLVLTALWFGLYRLGGYGARGGAIYLDPLRTPLAFIEALPTRFTLLWLELSTLPNSLYHLLSDDVARTIRVTSFVLCGVLTVGIARVAWSDNSARFWLVGTLLSIFPFCGVASGARLLFVPGVGSTALLALLVQRGCSSWSRRGTKRKQVESWAAGLVVSVSLGLHLVCAVAFVPMKMRTVERQNTLLRELAASLPVPADAAKHSTVFVLNTAGYLASLLTPFGRDESQRLQGLFVFAAAQRACLLARQSQRELRLDCPTGFLEEPSATFVRKPSEPFRLGETHRVGPANVRVQALSPQGSATSLTIEMENADDPQWVWTYWDGGEKGYHRISPPPVGSALLLPVRSAHRQAETDVWF